MKKALLSFALGAAVALVAVQSWAVPGSKTTITGKAIDIATFAMMGADDDQATAAARFRCEEGFPAGIVTENGEVWVAVYKNPAPASGLETGNAVLADLIGKDVVARGRAFKAAGINVFEISVISEM